MVFAGISALPVMREWFPAFQPVDKAANSPLPQSSSTPETPTTNKISPIAPAATQGTNNLGK
jgi:hypothetical protein